MFNMINKAGLHEELNIPIDIGFEGHETLILSELKNLRRLCFNYTLLKFFQTKKGKCSDFELGFYKKFDLTMPNVEQAIQKIIENEDMKQAKSVSNQLKAKSGQILKILFVYFLPIPHLRFRLLINLLFFLDEYPLTFLFKIIAEHLFPILLMEGNQDNILKFIEMMINLNKNSFFSENITEFETQKSNLIYFDRRFWKGYESNDFLEKTSLYYIKSKKDENNKDEDFTQNHSYFLQFYFKPDAKLVFKRMNTLNLQLRKHLLWIILTNNDLEHVRILIKQMITLNIDLTKNMPLKTFVSISKTFFCAFNYFTQNDKHFLNRKETKTNKLVILLQQYIVFCLDYFSQSSHFIQKLETEYSIKEFDIYKKLIENLYSMFLSFHYYLDCSIQEKFDGLLKGSKTFFSQNVKKYDLFSKNLKFIQPKFYDSQKSYTKEIKLKNLIEGCLFLIKSKVNSLIAKMYFNFQEIRRNVIFDQFEVISEKSTILFESIFDLNPLCAINFRDMLFYKKSKNK